MQVGLLWYDDSKADLADKVTVAAEAYLEKFGEMPNRCYVHPSQEGPGPDGIQIVGRASILPNHLWIGVEEDEESEAEITLVDEDDGGELIKRHRKRSNQ